MFRSGIFAGLVLVLGFSQNAFCDPETKGLLPVPNYSGTIEDRAYLSGDWSGKRSELAEDGVQFGVDWTNTLQSILDGGRNTDTEYGNTLDYSATFDLMKMGVMPGALIKFRAESLFGRSVNGDSGAILPVNTDGLFPFGSGLDDDITFTITSLNYTQFLSEEFGVTLGKFDTLDADPNEFASGRGTAQFMNANFIFDSVAALRLPYSTLGGGFVWLPKPASETGGLTVSSLLLSTTDSSENPGFDDFDNGLSWTSEINYQYRIGNLPGGQNLGFLYSFDQDFSKVGNRLVFNPGEGLTTPAAGSTWATYWSAWQYLHVSDPGKKPIDLTNKIADHQGYGVFARAGIADQDTNPVKFSFSLGLGGRGLCGRENDTYGLGYYYTRLQETRLTGFADLNNNTQGAEAYYNYAITPSVQLTLDLQTIDSMIDKLDTAFILGGRLKFIL